MMIDKGVHHRPALLKEAIDLLQVFPGKRYIDATIGSGGHGEEIVKRGGILLGIDWDRQMIKIAKTHLESVCPDGDWRLKEGNFSQISKIARKENFTPVSGIIFDLGVNVYHYHRTKRGFSFRENSFLDMRIRQKGKTAAELLKSASEKKLADVFSKFTQEKFYRQIAQAIVKERKNKVLTSRWLAELVEEVYRKNGVTRTKIHPATKVFLALRIWVNREFENLKRGIREAFALLSNGGRLVVISFHSGEDRLVKKYFKNLSEENRGKLLVSHPIFPSQKEKQESPLCRSAVLRGIQKIK